MFYKSSISVLLCALFTFASNVAFAQEEAEARKEAQRLLERFSSPRWILEQDAQERPGYRALWNGKSTWTNLRVLYRMGAAEELGLSEGQRQKFAYLHKDSELAAELIQRKYQEQDPIFMDLMEKEKQTLKPDDPHLLTATPEELEAFREASENYFTYINEERNRETEEALSEDQKLQLRSIEMQLLPEFGLASPGMFEPLGLSEEQKAEMEQIKASLTPVFEAMLDEMMLLRRERFEQVAEELLEQAREKPFATREELDKVRRKGFDRVDSDPEYRKKEKALALRGKEFATELKERLMDVLTDEQLDKMQEILDRTPATIKKHLNAMQKHRKASEKAGHWSPGPDSWRPGDGTPAEFKENRKTGRFPKKKKENPPQ